MRARRIRVLQVITSLAGGAGLHVYQLTRHLDPERFDVHLAFGMGYPLDARVAAEGLRHTPLSWQRTLNPMTALAGTLGLVRLLRSSRVDIVHAHCSLAGVLGRLVARGCRVPRVVFTVHAFASRDFQPAWRKRLFLAVERAMDRFTDHYCVSTNRFRDQILARGISGVDRISVIPLGLPVPPPPSPAARARARAALGLRPDELAVATAGRLEPQKGIADLLGAFRHVLERVPASRLLIFGDGPLRASLERDALRLGVTPAARFLGWRQDMDSLLAGTDLFCLASRWESFSYALLQAMAAALPIVATAVDGVPEVLEDGRQAVLVPPADEHALASALVRLLDDADRRNALGMAARCRVETTFPLDRMINRHEELYEALLAGVAPAQVAP